MLGVSVLFLLIGLCLGGFGLVMLILRITKKGSITLPIIVIPTAFVIVLASFIAVAVNAPDEASADNKEPAEEVEKVSDEKQDKESGKEKEDGKAEKKKNKTIKKEKKLTTEERVNKAVNDIVGKERIDKITYFEGYTTVFSEGSENLTKRLTVSSMHKDTLELIEELSKIKEVDTVSILWSLPLTDTYGNESDGKVMNMEFSRETLDKINFDNVNMGDIPDMADSYNLHNALK